MDVSDIVKLTFYVVGQMDAKRRGEVIASSLKGHKPCMTLVFVAALAAPIYKVELDAWAKATVDGESREPASRGSTARMVGRNDPCPCGSGKKYKHCCGRRR